ncbi:ATP synthase subunit O, mitochondrial, partial [Phlyctochytrium bullatum]
MLRMLRLPQSVRMYSTATVQVPLVLHGIEGRYATALFTAASKTNSLDAVESDIQRIKGAIAKDAGLQTFLETPILDRTAKKEGVTSLLSKGKYSEVTTNFFNLLAENGRLDHTSKIVGSFEQLLLAHRGEVPVVVTSAKELDAKLSRQVKDILQKSSLIEKNQKIIMSNKVDPSILGGLVIEIGDKTIDLSVSSKVSKLDRLLKEIDVDVDGVKIRDHFTWNIEGLVHIPLLPLFPFFYNLTAPNTITEKSITPEKFAEMLCDDLKLPHPHHAYVNAIVRAINEHLDDFYDHAGAVEMAGGGAEVMEEEGVVEVRRPGRFEFRVIVKLDITIDGISLLDQLEWDVNAPENSPELFADHMVTELGLSTEFRTAIAHAIREQTQIYTKSLFLLDHPFDDTPVDDDELATCFLEPVTAVPLVRDAVTGENFSPCLLLSREPEAEKVEKDKERDARRKRRQTNRNRRALPDRELQRSLRTPLPTPLRHPSAAAASANPGVGVPHNPLLEVLSTTRTYGGMPSTTPGPAGLSTPGGGYPTSPAPGIAGGGLPRRKTRSETAAEMAAGGGMMGGVGAMGTPGMVRDASPKVGEEWMGGETDVMMTPGFDPRRIEL